MRFSSRRIRGTALIVVVFVVLMLTTLAVTVVTSAGVGSVASMDRRRRAEAMAIAESGVGLTLERVAASSGAVLQPTNDPTLVSGPVVYTSDGGTVSVQTTVLNTDGEDNDGDGQIDEEDEGAYLRVVATGEVQSPGASGRHVQRTIEAYLQNQDHPAFYKAVYVGNETNDPNYGLTFGAGNTGLRDPSSDTPQHATNPAWETASHNASGDYIEGDVYVAGPTDLRGGTDIFGDVDSTSTVNGDVVDGAIHEGVSPITPPDLVAMDYDTIADEIIDDPSDLARVGFIEGDRLGRSSNYYGSKLSNPNSHDQPYYHLGDQRGDLNLTAADSGKLIVIKGDLWVHTTSSLTVNFPRGVDTHVTVVVEGNIYIADDIEYDPNQDGQGLLLIAKGKDPDGTTASESFVDQNMNYQWDPGEPILNDTGQIGVYEGPKEGQGNVYYGDPRFGTGGVTDGYIYAQNNVYLVNEGTDGNYGADERVWGVQGFLSAGNHMLLGDRQSGDHYENFRVNYDERFRSINFKGIPGPLGGNYAGVRVVSWRELPPGSN